MKSSRMYHQFMAYTVAMAIGSTVYMGAPVSLLAQETKLTIIDTEHTTSRLLKGDSFSITLEVVSGSSDLTTKDIDVQLSGEAVQAEKMNYEVRSGDEVKEDDAIIGLGEIITVHIYGLEYTGQGDVVNVAIKAGATSATQAIQLDTITDDEVKGALILDSSVASNMSVTMEAGETKNITLTIKNTSSETIDDSIVKVNFQGTTVGLGVIDGQYIEISKLVSGATRDISFVVDASETVAAGTYPIQVEINGMTQTVHLEVANDAVPPAITLSYDANQVFEEGVVTPLTLTLENVGDNIAQDIKLNVKNNDTIGIVGNSSLIHVGEIEANSVQHIELNILPQKAEALTTLEFDVSYKTRQGELIEETQHIYLNTENEILNEGQVLIQNMTQPTGTYYAGDTFTVGFSLISDGPVENAKVIVEGTGSVVPTSQNVYMVNALEEGVAKEYTINMMVVDSNEEGYQPIEVKVEYNYDEQPVTVTQYSGVNVAVIEEEEVEESVGYPKVIVSNSKLSSPSVEAGGQITLEVDLLNTHSSQTIKNLTVQYVLSETVGDSVTNQVFSPVQTGDTLYTSQILPGQTATQSMTLDVANDATNQDYPIQMLIEYEDEEGKEISMTQSVTVPVIQEALIEIGQISHAQLDQNQKNELTIPLYNRGQSDIQNVMIYLEGEGLEVDDNQLYISEFTKGSTQYYLPIVNPTQADTAVTLVAQYEGTNGQLTEVRHALDLPIIGRENAVGTGSTEMLDRSEMTDKTEVQALVKNREAGVAPPEMQEEENNTPLLLGIGGIVVVGLLAGLKWLKGKKPKEEITNDENL